MQLDLSNLVYFEIELSKNNNTIVTPYTEITTGLLVNIEQLL